MQARHLQAAEEAGAAVALGNNQRKQWRLIIG